MRIAVIGAGIHGATTAYFLTKADGTEVHLFDADSLGGLSTARSVGIIRHHYADRLSIRLVQRSLELYHRLEDEQSLNTVVKPGYLAVADEAQRETFESIVDKQQSVGVDVELVDPESVTDWLPFADSSEIAAAAIEHDGGFADPYQLTMGFIKGAADRGANVHPNTPVVDLDRHGNRIKTVQTPVESLDVDAVVNAAGPFGSAVADFAGIDLPISWHGATIAALSATEPYDCTYPVLMDLSSGLYVRPEHSGDFIAGGFGRIEASDPNSSLGGVTESHLLDLEASMNQRLPGLSRVEVVDTWSGWITDTPDGKQLIGPSSAVENFYLFTGGNGHGFKEAPAIGESLAAEIIGDTPAMDLSPFSAERFESGELFETSYTHGWIS